MQIDCKCVVKIICAVFIYNIVIYIAYAIFESVLLYCTSMGIMGPIKRRYLQLKRPSSKGHKTV